MYFSRIQFHDSFLLIVKKLIDKTYICYICYKFSNFFYVNGMPKHAVTFSPPTQSSFELINATCSEH